MINKIKITPDMVAIDYSVEFFHNEEKEMKINKYTVKSPEAPVMEFGKTLQELDYHLIELCELADKPDDIAVMCQDVEITGVTFKWKDDTFGAIITGQKVLAYSMEPLVLNSPIKLAQREEDDEIEVFDSMKHLKPTTVTVLKKLIEHAENYVNGIRAQVDITFDPVAETTHIEDSKTAEKDEQTSIIDEKVNADDTVDVTVNVEEDSKEDSLEKSANNDEKQDKSTEFIPDDNIPDEPKQTGAPLD